MTHPAARLPRPRRPRTAPRKRDVPRCECGAPLTRRTSGAHDGECYACALDRELSDPETPAPDDV